MLILCLCASAAELPDSIAASAPADSAKVHRSLVDKIVDYFAHSNKSHPEKRFDISFLAGPHYSSEKKFGIGLVAAGRFSTDRTDPELPPSDVSLYGDVSSVGFYMLGVGGTTILPHDRYRLVYDLYVSSFATKFWGIGYDNARCDANRTKYNKFQSNLTLQFLVNLGGSVFIGPEIDVNYVNAGGMDDRRLWQGQKLRVLDPGAGVTLVYDTRDNRTAPHRGWFLEFSQRFYPRWLGNNAGSFAATASSANYYQRLWRGAVLANRLHTRWAYGKVPWTMLSEMGSNSSMRGYYFGRYIDKFEADLTVELRQHVWRRNGVVLWLGVGTVAPSPSDVQFRHLLPNAGIGYRWEFKKDTNVRLDFGIGRGESEIIFNINEAF